MQDFDSKKNITSYYADIRSTGDYRTLVGQVIVSQEGGGYVAYYRKLHKRAISAVSQV